MDLQARKRITGASMSQFVGKAVTLLGELVELEPNGRMFTLKVSGKDVITVQLEEPIQDIIEGLVEVQGTVLNGNTIKCQNLVVFPTDLSQKFDMGLYNEVVALTERLPTHYVTMV